MKESVRQFPLQDDELLQESSLEAVCHRLPRPEARVAAAAHLEVFPIQVVLA
jgi:hypothetical protein